MSSINTLVADLEALLVGGGIKIDEGTLAATIAKRLASGDPTPSLRMSNFATPDAQLWFYINRPDLAEPLSPNARLNFLYGDIIDEIMPGLIEQAGHKVEGRQDELTYCGLIGHRDLVVDGVLLDVKSANSRSFEKFKYHRLETDDPFGYLDQLSLYLLGSKEDPVVKVKGEGAFLAVDKERGCFCLDFYKRKEVDYESEIKRKSSVIAGAHPPSCSCVPVPHGGSGNRKLGVRCSYNPFKWACHPGLRAFQYSNSTVYLTHVERTPDVPEVTEQYRRYTYAAS